MFKSHVALATAAFLAVALLAGCGGGGGGGGGTAPSPTTLIVTGVVTDSSNSPISGATVTEKQANVSATTNATGAWTMTLPASVSETTVTFDFYNTSGQLELVVQKTIDASAGGTFNLGTEALGPPPPPISPG